MLRRTVRLSAWLALAATMGLAPASADETDHRRVRGFAQKMIRGIGAEERECGPEVLREVGERRMSVVCARFEGSFARFELRWDLELLATAGIGSRSLAEPLPVVEPLTEWESNGAKHDRIYRVERKAVGVRFTGGDLLLVW